jgi:hypothetical protein
MRSEVIHEESQRYKLQTTRRAMEEQTDGRKDRKEEISRVHSRLAESKRSMLDRE